MLSRGKNSPRRQSSIESVQFLGYDQCSRYQHQSLSSLWKLVLLDLVKAVPLLLITAKLQFIREVMFEKFICNICHSLSSPVPIRKRNNVDSTQPISNTVGSILSVNGNCWQDRMDRLGKKLLFFLLLICIWCLLVSFIIQLFWLRMFLLIWQKCWKILLDEAMSINQGLLLSPITITGSTFIYERYLQEIAIAVVFFSRKQTWTSLQNKYLIHILRLAAIFVFYLFFFHLDRS